MRFTVFTHVIHLKYNGYYHAYSPYVREMNLWFQYADEVEVLAPSVENEIPEKKLKYEHSNLVFRSLPAVNLLNGISILRSLILFPVLFIRIFLAMTRADHIHIRCPGNIGLIACIAQVFFPNKRKSVKYAGNWDPNSSQPWSYKIQKWILKNEFLTKNTQVLVYGNWGEQGKNIIPFFTASFSEKDRIKLDKEFSRPFKFIYVGNLVAGKGLFEAVDYFKDIHEKGVSCTLEIYGDGILLGELKNYIKNKNLDKVISLMGRKDQNELKEIYKQAHFILLLSKSEGWPKVLAEAMWYGVIPITTTISCVPWMLNNGQRGILINKEELETNDTIQSYLKPQKQQILKNMSIAGMNWSRQFTVDKFAKDIKRFL